MTENQLMSSLTESSFYDTYILYGIIGLLILITLIGFTALIVTSCCWCFYSISFCFCCHQRHHLSYKLDKKFKKEDDNIKKSSYIKRRSSSLTDFSQLYDSCPHLINNKAVLQSGINHPNLDSSCTTINTLISPVSPRSSIRSLVESASSVPPNPVAQPFSYIKSRNDRTPVPRQLKPYDRSISPAGVSIDIRRISSSMTDSRTNSPTTTNIYETVNSTSNIHPVSDRPTPIYESAWTHNLKRLITNKKASSSTIINKANDISTIEIPSSSSSPSPPDLVPSNHYFQQQQHPYVKFLATRKKTSDSMRRANMLKNLKDDAAFLY